jgi:pyruvate dehydrogenase E2 component (dihydrolipoamide acetyltransferase)
LTSAQAPGLAAVPVTGIPFLEIEALPDFSQQGPVEREPIRSIRRKIAKKLTTSMILVPHVAHMDEADVTVLDEFRRQERERRAGQPGSRMSLLPFVVKAVAAGLQEKPMFNASLDPLREEIIYKKFYHVGIAVDSGRGLIVPVIRDADKKSIWTIAAEIEDLADRARANKLDPAELRGGTFTITNVGPLGGTGLIPTINYPEVAILGMGMARPKPVVHEGAIVARTVLPLTLCFDHRVADGADAARFVNGLVARLSDPLGWLLTA